MTKKLVFCWILCLTMVAVGVRNFELGLSSDGPIYSVIARNIVESHDWFRLDSSVPDYQPYFADHPHLAIWLVAATFKLFGVGDYASRIPGHIFYFGFLALLFFYIRRKTSEKTAILTLLFLWTWGRFSNSFSAVYLDPGVHFFGFLGLILFEEALLQNKAKLFFFSGLALSLVSLMKGLTLLGYFPALFVLCLYALKERKLSLKGLTIFAVAILIPILSYVFILKQSSAPDFLESYWARQVTNRFAKVASVQNLFSLHFWKPLIEDTGYYSLFAFLVLPKLFSNSALRLVWSISIGFILLYAPNLCSGAHYFIPIIPAFALGLATLATPLFRWSSVKFVQGWSVICILAIFVIQYIPVRTHGMRPTQGEELILALHKQNGIETLIVDGTPYYTDFINTSRYAWWGHVKIEQVKNQEAIPSPQPKKALLLFWQQAHALRNQELQEKGWCLLRRFSERSVWLPCPIDTTLHLPTVYEK